MANGVISLPLEKGKRELFWYVGNVGTGGTNTPNVIVSTRVDRDADFVAKRAWLVMWPSFTSGGFTVNTKLSLPATAQAFLQDGQTKRTLSLQAGLASSMVPDADPAKMVSNFLGLPAPYLIKSNNNVFAQVNYPGATATAWQSDLYFVMEGFKLYPSLPVDIQKTIQAYALPFGLNGLQSIANPNTVGGNLNGQVITITNNGSGKFLAKGISINIVDANGVDQTPLVLAFTGFNIQDSSSGSKRWIDNPNLTPGTGGSGVPCIPGPLLNMAGTWMPFNTPRLIDENGIVQVQVVFPQNAGALAYANGFAWPMTFSFNIWGALLPA